MKVRDGGFADIFKMSKSCWIASTPQTDYSSLKEDIKVDVVIVGGGMAGITSAYLLSQEGLKVAVLEADRIVLGTTGHTTAKLTSQHELIYNDLLQKIGEEKTRQYAEANERAIDFVKNLIEKEKINCDFSMQSAYVYTKDDQYVEKIQQETEAAQKLGIKAHFDTKLDIPLSIKGAVRFDNQAQFHPRKYLLDLAKRIEEKGSLIFENTKVIDVRGSSPYIVTTEEGKEVTATYVIMATHYPMHLVPGLFFTKIYQERAYAVVAKAKEKFPGGMYLNAEMPNRSLRSLPTDEGEMILIVGETHKTGHGENLRQHYANLKAFAQELFTVEDFPYHWSTQDGTTIDDIPYIGQMVKDKPNIYIATGFRKWGMTNSTVAGLMLRDLIIKGESPWQEVYDPSRVMTGEGTVQFLVQNANVAYDLISGKLQAGEVEYDLKPGEAVVARVDGQRAGVYMDQDKKLHVVDTSCTHLGCELRWNDAELSWDCPCHGSRFTVDGEVVHGPALKPLEKLSLESE